MSLPKEPRQKMINMMYLVLTALLALNVSSEILHAFKTVNNSLINSNVIIENKNKTLLSSLKEKLAKAETHDKAAIWLPNAEKAQRLADDLNGYIKGLQDSLVMESGFNPKDSTFREDNLDAATRFLVDSKKGEELHQKLANFKTQLLGIDEKIAKEFANTLPIDLSTPKSANSSVEDWSYGYFHMTPTIAALTILSKFQNDVKNSEAQVIEFCHKEVGAVEIVFDQYVPLVGTNSNYLMPGQELMINAGIGAYNKSSNPRISVDGSSIAINAQGVAEYKTNVGSVGSFSKRVHIEFFNQATGKQDSKDYEVKYTVGSPTGINVSADAVKVLYIGLDNPISISGGAKGAEAVQAKIDNGHINKLGGGKFMAVVETPGKAVITPIVEGKPTSPSEFMVKYVPLPVPMVGTKSSGKMGVNEFKAQQGVRADLRDFFFQGVKYTVAAFTIVCTGKGFEATGPKFAINNGAYFSSEARGVIEMCKAGSSVIITDITVEGPGGQRKLDAGIALNLTQ